MPSGAIPLLEAVKYGDGDLLKKGVVETIVRESPILEMLPFETLVGEAIKQRVEESLPDMQFRDVNETYERSWGTDTDRFWGVSILGSEVFVDNFELKVAANKARLKARQYAKFAKANAMTFDKSYFDGTGTAKDFKGVNVLISEGLGQAYVVGGSGGNGGTLALSDLDEAVDLMRKSTPDAIHCNRFHRRKITNLARTTHSGFSLIDVGTDSFGRKVTVWNDTPLRIIGDDKDGNPLLDFDETQGSNSDCSSLYMVKFGHEEVCGLMGAGGSFEVKDFGETEAAPGHLGRIEWYPGLAIFNHYSVVRVSGIRES
jgi:hypothetical protein